MLHGRDDELSRIRAIVDAARSGASCALVLVGEPGIGKTTLLDAAVEHAAGAVQVLQTRGYESERELPFAGLYQLLSPRLEVRERIPPVQASALGTALAVEPPAPHDPFAVPAAVLSMFGAIAEDGPLLVVVDDLQWLDPASQRAVLFAARRLGAEGAGILLGTRPEPDLLPLLDGLDQLRLAAVGRDAAHAILREVAGGPLADTVADDLVRTSGGNPLALKELPAALTDAQRAGLEPPALRLPQGSVVERAFRARFDGLGEDARRALTLVAAFESGPVALAIGALEKLGLGLAEIEQGEEAGMLRIARGTVSFNHPLLRSLAYHAAPSSSRIAAHRALADVATDPSVRAWHLSAAALGPDAHAAAALDLAAADARARGASAEAAAASHRAAELSASAADGVRRYTEAATDLALAGRAEEAVATIERATKLDPLPAQATLLSILRGRADVRRGALADGRAVLAAQGEALAAEDPLTAALLFLDAGVADIMLGDTEAILHDGTRAEELAAGRNRDLELSGVLLRALGLVPVGRADEARPLLERATPVLLEADPLIAPAEVFAFGAQVAMWLEQYDLAQEVLERQIAILRGASAIGRLPFSLAVQAHLSFRLGRWDQARASADEAVALARQTGQVPQIAFGLAPLSLIHSARGEAEAALATARECSAIVDQLGPGPLRIYSAAALGFAAMAADAYGDALDHLRSAAQAVADLDGVEPGMLQFDPELVELLVRAGDRDGALERLRWLEAAAAKTGGAWAHGVAARVRGQLASDADAAGHFEAALEWHAQDRQPFVVARTQLAYGQRLRRAGERTASRAQLMAAGEAFERFGAAGWAARAREELQASGQTLRRRSMPDAEELTPGELQVALRVAEGLTNREVAAAIFLSPKTVEHHLSAIYRKLGIRSRTELARHMSAGEPAPGAV